MKFGKRLEEEMVEQWANHYVSYKRLKQLIMRLKTDSSGDVSGEVQKVFLEEMAKAEKLFMELLEELEKRHGELLEQDPTKPSLSTHRSSRFYPKRVKRSSIASTRVNVTDGDNQSVTEHADDGESTRQSLHSTNFDDESDQYKNEGLSLISYVKNFFLGIIGDSRSRIVDRETPRGMFIEWYSHAYQLQHFAELNQEAIRKGIKKLKKHLGRSGHLSATLEAHINRSRLVTLMSRLHNLMSDIQADFERKFDESLDRYEDVSLLSGKWHAKWRYLFLAFAMFCLCMYLPILSPHPPAHNCVALFVLVIILWVTEAIPFFCTAMIIPIFAVPLGIIQDPATREAATATVASGIILGKVMDHIQILVLGGLTIGKALGRTNLEVYAASTLHSMTAHRPALYLLGVMAISCILCAFVSNIAAPLLVLGVIQRTLWEFPEDCHAPHAILLGLAFACNVGGMLSPIASPQNAVAMSALGFHNLSFGVWVAVAAPMVAFMILVEWAYIIIVWKPFKDVQYIPLQVVNLQASKQATALDRAVVIVVSLITVILWILPADLLFGDTGVVALIPIVVFFGIGILNKEDFNTLSWHLMFLLAGGNMLGLCARDSQMLDIIAAGMRNTVGSQSGYLTLVVVVSVVAVVTTFVSHTVAAMIMLPIIVKIGFLLPMANGWLPVSPASLVLVNALMCSGAMAFPISSFPNVNSLLAEDSTGKPYLRAKDFLVSGTFITLVFYLCLITWMVPFTFYVLG